MLADQACNVIDIIEAPDLNQKPLFSNMTKMAFPDNFDYIYDFVATNNYNSDLMNNIQEQLKMETKETETDAETTETTTVKTRHGKSQATVHKVFYEGMCVCIVL